MGCAGEAGVQLAVQPASQSLGDVSGHVDVSRLSGLPGQGLNSEQALSGGVNEQHELTLAAGKGRGMAGQKDTKPSTVWPLCIFRDVSTCRTWICVS